MREADLVRNLKELHLNLIIKFNHNEFLSGFYNLSNNCEGRNISNHQKKQGKKPSALSWMAFVSVCHEWDSQSKLGLGFDLATPRILNVFS